MCNRNFQFDFLRLRFIYKLQIQGYQFPKKNIQEYVNVMKYLGIHYTDYIDIQNYKKLYFIRYCCSNKRFDKIPIDMVVSFINIQENLN